MASFFPQKLELRAVVKAGVAGTGLVKVAKKMDHCLGVAPPDLCHRVGQVRGKSGAGEQFEIQRQDQR